jgi:hypothetical protein
MKTIFMLVLTVFSLGGCVAYKTIDGRPLPPNYWIHQLGYEGGGG